MRKKQLFAILLAGAMTAGTVPSAALAAENDIPAASSEVTEGENSGEIPQEEGGEPTPEAEPTQTPETAPEAPTETPANPQKHPQFRRHRQSLHRFRKQRQHRRQFLQKPRKLWKMSQQEFPLLP